VLNAAARVVSGTHKFDQSLSRLLSTELHWLDVPEQVVYKLGVMVFNCLHGQAPSYLVELCQPVAGVASRQHLPSATRQLLDVPRHQLRSYGWSTGFPCGWSVGLEFPAGQLAESAYWREQFQTISEDVSVRNVY